MLISTVKTKKFLQWEKEVFYFSTKPISFYFLPLLMPNVLCQNLPQPKSQVEQPRSFKKQNSSKLIQIWTLNLCQEQSILPYDIIG